MRAHLSEKLEAARVTKGAFATSPEHGPFGTFVLHGPSGCDLRMTGHPREGWEHVSVSTGRHRCPNWPEMCFAKDLFWDEEEAVVQYHPPLSQYVKNNRYCLHLWKPKDAVIPMPPSIYVGFVGLGPEETAKLLESLTADEWRQLANANATQQENY